jgi:NAD(P)-dependent dehydrogenase (short-subunit alcohol dehydrogenase family)
MSSPDAAQGKNVQQKQEKSKEKESNMGKLDGKIALVTGASKGIGAGIALSLAKEGAAVAVNYASDRKGADRVVERIKAAGGKAIAVQGSVTSSEEIDRFFSETEKQLGNVDVLVNNAGVFAYLPLQDVNEKEFHRQFDTNVLGLLLTSKRAANQFGEKGGCIINIGFGSKHTNSSRIVDLRSNEECGGRYYPCAREGTRTAEHPRELHQPWRN